MSAETLLLSFEDAKLDEAGVLTVSGWAAGSVEVEAIEVGLGDAPLGKAEYGRARADVYADHPDLPGAATAGFWFSTTLAGERLGAPEAVVTARFQGGGVRSAYLNIARVEKPAPAANLDENLLFSFDIVDIFDDGAAYISGWAAHPHVVRAIEARIDGVPVGAAILGGERADVGDAHAAIPSARSSGFQWRGKAAVGQDGEALVTLVVVTAAGETYVRERTAIVKPASVVTRVERQEIRLFVDSPAIVGGAFANPVQRMLSIEGWAVARSGLAAIEVYLDGAPVASAIRGLRRLDIGASFADWPDSLVSGFAVMLPRKLFARDRHVLRLEARDKLGQTKDIELQVTVDLAGPDDEKTWLRPRVTQSEVDLKLGLISVAPSRPAFIIVLASNAREANFADELAETLDSIAAQAYPEFGAVLLAPSRSAAGQAAEIATARHIVGLKVVEAGADLDRSIASAAEHWRASDREPYFLCLRLGDRLGADALIEFALAIATRPEEDFVYADDIRFDAGRARNAAYLKPEWSPDLIWSTHYIGRCWCASVALLERARIAPSQALATGDYDLVLRLTEAARKVGHAPLVLAKLSPARDGDEQEMLALGRAMARRGVEGGVRPGAAPGVYRARRRIVTKGLVSIVIATMGSRGLIETCIDKIRKLTLYRRFEIVCVDNIRDPTSTWKAWLKQHADRVVEDSAPFNWSKLNNIGAEAARGEFLLFLNDDIEIIHGRWLHALVEHAQRPEVGAVGARLLYPDRRVQHAGMFLVDRNARHAFRFADENEAGPFGMAAAQRNVAAVTGACMLMRREVFEAIGRFDEGHTVVNNDVDLCLRLWRAGKRVVYTPHATLVHHEMASRAELRDTFDETGFDAAWRDTFARGDPFFHPKLSRDDTEYTPDLEPTRLISTGRPLIARSDVRHILVQKLDHVGDFVTGLPALRRLQQRFPQAEIHVLAPTASIALARLVPEIANVIEFNFFHHVSQQGRLEFTENDARGLEAKLAAYRFDIAIDLRKHTETRDILKHSGARLTAGFDIRGRFPWLDVVLEWDGDAPYLPKRAQVADDYVALVEAVSLACERERRFLEAPSKAEALRSLRALPAIAALRPGLFDRSIVCVHPAAGNVLRQWPTGHFAELVDLVVAAFDVNIVLIGAPNEMAIADDALAQIRAGDRVWSLVGKTQLSDLPALLCASSLFVGNNSGPHHIAAALGAPTIGVHSGVVSAREWGPLGPKAVALQREMSCGPCYLDKPGRCSRGLACLRGLRPAEVFRVCEQMLGPSLRRAPALAPPSLVSP